MTLLALAASPVLAWLPGEHKEIYARDGTNLFNNTGAFAKNSPSVTVFGIPFTNQAAGVVNVNDGTLALLGGGTNFGELIDIFASTWADFDMLRSMQEMRQTLSSFNKIRNVVAHSCALNDDEIKRFELTVKDWFRIQLE